MTRLAAKLQSELGLQVELQADCLAGGFARHVERDLAVLEDGDLDEARDGMYAIGDRDVAWRRPGAHGA